MSAIDDARRVAADMLRQAGDETGALVLEHAHAAIESLRLTADFHHCCTGAPGEMHQNGCQAAEALHDLEWWHDIEVEMAWSEALVMARQLGRVWWHDIEVEMAWSEALVMARQLGRVTGP